MKASVAWFASVSLLALGCGGGDGNNPANTSNKYVANGLTLPTSSSQLAVDLNGDNRPDDQLGVVIGLLAGAGINAQTAVDAAIAGGQAIILMDVQAGDLTTDSGAETRVYLGNAVTTPDFSGNGTFTVATGVSGARFNGGLAGAVFNSSPSPARATATTQVTIQLRLPLLPGQTLNLTLNGAALRYTTTATGLMAGQINGSVKRSELLPPVAGLITALIANGTITGAVRTLLDPNNDGTVTVAELEANTLVGPALAADIQVFNASGQYAPCSTATGCVKDSLSVGLGFRAVKANFTPPAN